MLKNARFSPDGTHRYCLSRIWDDRFSKIAFVGLNPSTANQYEDDATIRRLITFAKSWGFGGLYMLNAYSFKATDPEELKEYIRNSSKSTLNTQNKTNLGYVKKYTGISGQVVFCWGTNIPESVFCNAHTKRLVRLIKTPYCFGITKEGYPRHPLYLASHTELQVYHHTPAI